MKKTQDNKNMFTMPHYKPSLAARIRMHSTFAKKLFQERKLVYRLGIFVPTAIGAMMFLLVASGSLYQNTQSGTDPLVVHDRPDSAKRELIERKITELRIARIQQATVRSKVARIESVITGGNNPTQNKATNPNTLERIKRRFPESGPISLVG